MPLLRRGDGKRREWQGPGVHQKQVIEAQLWNGVWWKLKPVECLGEPGPARPPASAGGGRHGGRQDPPGLRSRPPELGHTPGLPKANALFKY